MCLNLSYLDGNSSRFRYTKPHLRLGKGFNKTARCADLFESSLSDTAWNKLKSHEVALIYKKSSKYNTRLSFYRRNNSFYLPPYTSPFKSMYYQISCKNSCRKTIEASVMKTAPNESKLIYAINIFIVVSLCLLISYGSQLNTQTN